MNKGLKLKHGLFLFRASVLCLILAPCGIARAQRYRDFTTPTPLKGGDTLVLGFMGGRESWDNHKRGVRKLALKLRAMKLPGVHVETVENKKRRLALELVSDAFDRDPRPVREGARAERVGDTGRVRPRPVYFRDGARGAADARDPEVPFRAVRNTGEPPRRT